MVPCVGVVQWRVQGHNHEGRYAAIHTRKVTHCELELCAVDVRQGGVVRVEHEHMNARRPAGDVEGIVLIGDTVPRQVAADRVGDVPDCGRGGGIASGVRSLLALNASAPLMVPGRDVHCSAAHQRCCSDCERVPPPRRTIRIADIAQ